MIDLRNFIKETLSEAIRSEGEKFDIRKFKQIGSAAHAFSYAFDRLKKISQGSSRMVFLLSSSKALKVVNIQSHWPKAGIGQNELEVSVYTDPKTKILVPKIYDYHPNYLWIISELVKPFGIQDYGKALNALGIDEPGNPRSAFVELVRYGIRNNLNGVREWFDTMNPDIEALVQGLHTLATENNIDANDLMKVENWGLNLEGKLVLLDSGFSQDVFRQFYKNHV